MILPGSDAPDLASSHVTAAVESLAEAPVVIGPAQDGGYWLQGLAERAPHLFRDMPWSTDALFACTVERASARGAEPRMLQTLADLDRPEDLSRWPERAA